MINTTNRVGKKRESQINQIPPAATGRPWPVTEGCIWLLDAVAGDGLMVWRGDVAFVFSIN